MSSTTRSHGQSFSIPSNVTVVRASLYGENGVGGSQGGFVEADVPVTGGDTLYIRGSNTGGARENGGTQNAGDYIDLRKNGTALTDQLLVAAGGGGEGNDDTNTVSGGDGGPDTGEDGTFNDGGAGGGGTQSAGGSGGSGTDPGEDGSREFGGDGGLFFDADFYSGGGGGGYYGGGGGGYDAGGGSGGGGSNYVDSSVTNATNQRGGGMNTPEVQLQYAPEPTGVAIDALTETGEGEVEVDASAATGYDADSTWTVYRSVDGSQGTQVHTETGDGDLLWTDTNAPTGDVVYYTVELSNLSGTDSTQSSIIVRAAAVTDTTVDATRDAEIDLSWTESSAPDIDSYEILLAEASGSGYADYSQTMTASSSPATVTGLENGEQYYVTVRATNASNAAYDSRYGNEDSGTTTMPAPTIDSTEDTA